MSVNIFTYKNSAFRDIGLLIFIILIAYFPFLGLPAWEGNETIRVIIAKDMLQTGNWTIPILHGKLYFAKPPLMNWLIAASGSLFGSVNEWTSRLPSVITMFLTGVLVYSGTQKWLSREARIFAAIMTLAMIGMLKKGREAEIESLHIFVITSILLVWINGYLRQWKPALLWGLSLFLAGIGFLSKGPQVLMFFYMTVIPYLIYRKNISLLFSKGHLFGLVVLLMVLSVYILSVLQWTTLDYYINRWINEGMTRAESKETISFFTHLIEYPFEGIASFMPCILFFFPLFNKGLWHEFRKSISNELFVFCVVLLLANFPLYWLLPNMRFRYFLPAGPFFAISAGVIFEWYLKNYTNFSVIETFKRRLLKIISAFGIIVSIAVVPVVIALKLSFTLPLIFLLLLVYCISLPVFIKANSISLKQTPFFIVLITVLLFLIYTNAEIQYKNIDETNQRTVARKINLILPADVDTVYEIGYRRFLGITSYIDKKVLQLDYFSELENIKMQNRKVCFIFDTEYMKRMEKKEKNFFLNRVSWQKIYSKNIKKSRGEIIVGLLE